MGQRHQLFIRIENPLKKETLKGAITKSEKSRIKEAELYFGKGKYSIIPFHHQWLFGATAVSILMKILKETKIARGEHHPFSNDFSSIPYQQNYDKISGYGAIELIQALFMLTDFETFELTGMRIIGA